jgi:hypothetical protein
MLPVRKLRGRGRAMRYRANLGEKGKANRVAKVSLYLIFRKSK